MKNSPAADSTAPTRSKAGIGPCTPGSLMRWERKMMTTTSSACATNAKRQLAALVINPPMSGPAAEPIPAAALIAPNAAARHDIVIEDRCEDIDRWDQQGGPNALAKRVARNQ